MEENPVARNLKPNNETVISALYGSGMAATMTIYEKEKGHFIIETKNFKPVEMAKIGYMTYVHNVDYKPVQKGSCMTFEPSEDGKYWLIPFNGKENPIMMKHVGGSGGSAIQCCLCKKSGETCSGNCKITSSGSSNSWSCSQGECVCTCELVNCGVSGGQIVSSAVYLRADKITFNGVTLD